MSLHIKSSIPAQPSWRPLVVDHVRTRVVIDDQKRYNNFIKSIWLINKNSHELGVKTKIVKKSFFTFLVWRAAPKSKSIACIKMGIAYKQRYLSLSLFPSNGTRDQLVRFLTVFDALYDDLYSACLYPLARVNHLELAVDYLTIPMHSFLVMLPRMMRSNIFVNKDGSKGTLCEGNFLGKAGCKVYDKAQEQIAKLGSAPFPIQTRIEAFMNRLPTCMAGLDELSNPLLPILVLDKADAGEASQLSVWKSFLVNADKLGTAVALQLVPAHQRKMVRAIFKAHAASWWKPQEVWKGFPAALQMLVPPPSILQPAAM